MTLLLIMNVINVNWMDLLAFITWLQMLSLFWYLKLNRNNTNDGKIWLFKQIQIRSTPLNSDPDPSILKFNNLLFPM